MLLKGTYMTNKNVEREIFMVKELLTILDYPAFVKPLSEFWKGCNRETCPLVGIYGVWLSGEGGSMIDDEYAAYYYDKELSKGHPKLQKFMKKHNLKLRWFDCGTPILLFEEFEL